MMLKKDFDIIITIITTRNTNYYLYFIYLLLLLHLFWGKSPKPLNV